MKAMRFLHSYHMPSKIVTMYVRSLKISDNIIMILERIIPILDGIVVIYSIIGIFTPLWKTTSPFL